jgi:hypothetical protein
MQNTMQAPTVAAVGPAKEPSRETFRRFGQLFVQRLDSLIDEVAHRYRPIPGGQLTKDLLRGHAASMETYGAALAAIAFRSPAACAEIFVSLAAWLHIVRPMPEGRLKCAALRESKEQGEADVAIWGAVDAVERKDPAALDRAIIETREHVVALQELLAVLEQERAKLFTPKPKYRVVQASRLVAAGARS